MWRTLFSVVALFLPHCVMEMGSYNCYICLKLTVPKQSFEQGIDGIKGPSFSLLNLIAWGKQGRKRAGAAEEPRWRYFKGLRLCNDVMLAVLPLGFARPMLCGQVKWKRLQRIGPVPVDCPTQRCKQRRLCRGKFDLWRQPQPCWFLQWLLGAFPLCQRYKRGNWSAFCSLDKRPVFTFSKHKL